VFVPGLLFQLSLMFVGKARSLITVERLKCALRHQTRLEKPARNNDITSLTNLTVCFVTKLIRLLELAFTS
jgi:hypothetical protein